MGKSEGGSNKESMDTERLWAYKVLSRNTWRRLMILKETKSIHWDTEMKTKQTDDKVEQVVNE